MVHLLHFKDKFAKQGKALELSENELLKVVISKTQVKETSDGFALGRFKGSSRLNSEFIQTSYIALDFDSGNRLYEIQDKFRSYWHVIYSSLSHTTDHQKFRLLLKLSEPLSQAEYQLKMKPLIHELDSDKSCSNPSRLWFGGKEVISSHFSGQLYHLRSVPQSAQPFYHSQKATKPGLSEKSKRFLEAGAPKGEWHHARLSFLINAYHQGFKPDEDREIFSKNHVLDRDDEFHIQDVYQRYFHRKVG